MSVLDSVRLCCGANETRGHDVLETLPIYGSWMQTANREATATDASHLARPKQPLDQAGPTIP